MKAPALKTRDSEHHIESELRFVTPMFGGGVRLDEAAPHHKHPDALTPVRGAALRGALRAWWRRTCGARLAPEVLRAREQVLWGWARTDRAGGAGLVGLSVRQDLRGSPVQVYRQGKDRVRAIDSDLAYGAFPLQPADGARDKTPGTLTEWSGTFTVTLELAPWTAHRAKAARAAWGQPVDADDLWDEVELTWRAFSVLGGLGGRTRRGFGAVEPIAGAPDLMALLGDLGWEDYALSEPRDTANKAWREALGRLRDFRQGRNLGRNQGADQKRPGRSRWPEPDTLRRITGEYAHQHRPKHPVQGFPRATFGLPIIFHFKDQKDPGNTSLVPRGRQRLSSPLLLRPVRVGHQHHPLALVLPSDELTAVLRDLALGDRPTHHTGLPPEPEQILPLQGRLRRPHLPPALDAFLTFFTE